MSVCARSTAVCSPSWTPVPNRLPCASGRKRARSPTSDSNSSSVNSAATIPTSQAIKSDRTCKKDRICRSFLFAVRLPCRCGVRRGGACLLWRLSALPLVCFLSPNPPTPFPAGRGGLLLYFAGGFAPGTPALNRLRHLQSLPCGHPQGGLAFLLACLPCL